MSHLTKPSAVREAMLASAVLFEEDRRTCCARAQRLDSSLAEPRPAEDEASRTPERSRARAPPIRKLFWWYKQVTGI